MPTVWTEKRVAGELVNLYRLVGRTKHDVELAIEDLQTTVQESSGGLTIRGNTRHSHDTNSRSVSPARISSHVAGGVNNSDEKDTSISRAPSPRARDPQTVGGSGDDLVDRLTACKIRCMRFEANMDYIHTLFGKAEASVLDSGVMRQHVEEQFEGDQEFPASMLDSIRLKIMSIERMLSDHNHVIDDMVEHYNNSGALAPYGEFYGTHSHRNSVRSHSTSISGLPEDAQNMLQPDPRLSQLFDADKIVLTDTHVVRNSPPPRIARAGATPNNGTNENPEQLSATIENEILVEDDEDVSNNFPTEIQVNVNDNEDSEARARPELEAEFANEFITNQPEDSNLPPYSLVQKSISNSPNRSPTLGANSFVESPGSNIGANVSQHHSTNGLRNRNTNRDELLGSSYDATSPGEGEAENTQSMISMNKKRQEQLTDALLKMSSQLKRNAEQFSSDLVSDRKAIQDAEDAMAGNLSRLQVEKYRVQRLHSSSWTTTWFVWGSVLLVCIVFVLMVLFMRLFGKSR